MEVKGFYVVPVRVSESATHYMYIKKHSSADKELSERSLFVLNPVLNSSLSQIKSFFQQISTSSIIENYLVNDENLDYDLNLSHLTSELYDNDKQEVLKIPNNSGLVIFIDKSAANLALTKIKKYIKSKEMIQWKFNDVKASVKYQNYYKKDILPLKETFLKVNESLEDFNNREIESIKNLQQSSKIVDEDGFQLVVGKSRKTKKAILGKISSVTSINTAKTAEKLNKKEKQDFYRFQIRERKKQEMNELLKKFKDDQERIKELKEKKRFKPY